MPEILGDIWYSARSFARTPGFALTLLFTIALGIGSNAVIYGFAPGLPTHESPLTAVDRFVSFFGSDVQRQAGTISFEDYLLIKKQVGAFEWIGAARVSQRSITISGRSPVMSVAAITSDLADLLDLTLVEGVAISHRTWQSEFGERPDIRGEQIRIGNVDSRVAAIAPEWLEGLYFGRSVDVWTLLGDDIPKDRDRASPNLWVFGRLRGNVSPGEANLALAAGHAYSSAIRVTPYTGLTPDISVGFSNTRALLGLAAGAVFLVTCANVGLFLLGRASARSRETSLRVALGASRRQLARALLSDSVVISVVGGACGILLAIWTSRVVPAFLFQEDAERLVFAPDALSIVLASAACAGITVLFGLLPVFVIPHDRPAAILQREAAGPSKRVRNLRAGLVVAQMASCCALVVSGAFLVGSLRSALKTSAARSLGEPVLATMQTSPDFGIRYFESVALAAQAISDVSVKAWSAHPPGSQPNWRSFRIEPPRLPLREVRLDIAAFTARSIPLFKLPPVAGRMFRMADRLCRVAVIDEAAARLLFGSETAGRFVEEPSGQVVEIVAVIGERDGNPGSSRRSPTIYYDYTDLAGDPPGRISLAPFHAPVVSDLAHAELDATVVSSEYFRTMSFSLVAGHIFPDIPSPRPCRVAVVNQEASDLYFGGKAIGAAVIDDTGRRTEIIGVVRAAPLGTFQRRIEPTIYFPMEQDYPPYMTLVLAAQKATPSLLDKLYRTIEAVPGRGPAPIIVKTLEAHLGQTALAPLRIATTIVGACGVTAFMLSILGLYGALSDAARQRRRELAVRIALGAQRRHVIGQVLGEGARLACAGTLVGLSASLVLTRPLVRITSSGSQPDLWVWLTAPAVLAGTVGIASILPARRSLMVNPVTLMRDTP